MSWQCVGISRFEREREAFGHEERRAARRAPIAGGSRNLGRRQEEQAEVARRLAADEGKVAVEVGGMFSRCRRRRTPD